MVLIKVITTTIKKIAVWNNLVRKLLEGGHREALRTLTLVGGTRETHELFEKRVAGLYSVPNSATHH
jgi:hypothetical protein